MAIITLTTDFGVSSPYVAEMKAVLLSDCEESPQIVDISHAIPAQDILQGQLALRQVCPRFPAGTIHVAVVDPGVGTARRVLLVESAEQYFVGPDNGLLTPFLDDARVWQLDRPEFWATDVTHTFHGRDLMAPIAAELANGREPDVLGSPMTEPAVRMTMPQVQLNVGALEGQIVQADSFGNLITNISLADLAQVPEPRLVLVGDQRLPISPTYGAVQQGQPLALVGSSGWLEVAVNGGSAASSLQLADGARLRVVADNPSGVPGAD